MFLQENTEIFESTTKLFDEVVSDVQKLRKYDGTNATYAVSKAMIIYGKFTRACKQSDEKGFKPSEVSQLKSKFTKAKNELLKLLIEYYKYGKIENPMIQKKVGQMINSLKKNYVWKD